MGTGSIFTIEIQQNCLTGPSLMSQNGRTIQKEQNVDGIGLLVGARVYIQDDLDETTVDTIPITDLRDLVNNDYHTLYYLQTSYREEMDTDPTGQVEWGFYPVFGYFNETSEYPALSRLPDSWPTAGPHLADRSPGEWNGRFGRGVTYADLETYFVVNDAHDLEYLGEDDKAQYYPRYSSKKIGETYLFKAGISGADLVSELRPGGSNGITHRQGMLYSGSTTFRILQSMTCLRSVLVTGLIMQLVVTVQMMKWVTLMIFWICPIPGMKMESVLRGFFLESWVLRI